MRDKAKGVAVIAWSGEIISNNTRHGSASVMPWVLFLDEHGGVLRTMPSAPVIVERLSSTKHEINVNIDFETWEKTYLFDLYPCEIGDDYCRSEIPPAAIHIDPVTGMEFTLIRGGGYFDLGDDPEKGATRESTDSSVLLKEFYLAKYETTQAQWEKIMGANPSYNQKPDHPVELVSWNDVQNFINKLNAASGENYRLPTEAEWEFAARSGYKREIWAGTNNEADLGDYAWDKTNSDDRSHPVGKKKPNSFGLFDMSGNVWELCQNPFGGDPTDAETNKGSQAVPMRGGSWYSSPKFEEATTSVHGLPSIGTKYIGFRLYRPAPEPMEEPEEEEEELAEDKEPEETRDDVKKTLEQTDEIKNTKPEEQVEKKLVPQKPPKSDEPPLHIEPITGMEFVFIKGGELKMGFYSEMNPSEEARAPRVNINDFQMGKYEVTQSQWKTIMKENPSHNKASNHPVEMVSWNDVQKFIVKLNKLTGENYRLPTEAEWEYAAKGGDNQEKWAGARDESTLGDYAWDNTNSKEASHPVGSKKPNQFGLFDMSGNVWEWCGDAYKSTPSTTGSENQKDSGGAARVMRGGSWYSFPKFEQTTFRVHGLPEIGTKYIGFRLVKPKNQPPDKTQTPQ